MARPYAAFGAGSAKKHRPAVKAAPVVAKAPRYNSAKELVKRNQYLTRNNVLGNDYSDKKTSHGRALRKQLADKVRKANFYR